VKLVLSGHLTAAKSETPSSRNVQVAAIWPEALRDFSDFRRKSPNIRFLRIADLGALCGIRKNGLIAGISCDVQQGQLMPKSCTLTFRSADF